MSEARLGDAPVSAAMQRWRVGLVLFGIALLTIGAITLLNDVPASRYPGIALWLFGALVVHDGIGAVAVFGVSVVLRRLGRRIPWVVIVIAQSALAVAVIVAVLVIPAILKQGIGSANPTILPLDYGLALLVFAAVLAVLTAVAIGVALAVRPRRVDATGD